MKLLFVLLALPVMASKCGKEEKTKDAAGLLEGKIVRVTCASTVIQVLNDDSVGEDGWKDMMNNDAKYDNVFAVSNACKLPAGIAAGGTIRFKTNPATQNDCVACMMFDAPPAVKFDLSDVSAVSK